MAPQAPCVFTFAWPSAKSDRHLSSYCRLGYVHFWSKMDKLPLEINCIILSYVDITGQLNCRLVCRSLNDAFCYNMRRVSVVSVDKLNDRESWLLHTIFMDSNTVLLRINYKSSWLEFLNFIVKKYGARINVLFTAEMHLQSDSQFKLFHEIADKLVYLEAPHLLDDPYVCVRIEKRLSSLVAVGNGCLCFCNFKSQSIQFNDLCPFGLLKTKRSLHDIHEANFNNIFWLILQQENAPDTFPNIPHLLALGIRFRTRQKEERSFNFSYPNLKYFEMSDDNPDITPTVGNPPFCQQIVRSLKKSTKVQTIVFKGDNRWFHLPDLLEMALELKNLRRLMIDFQFQASDTRLIPLNRNLIALNIKIDSPFLFDGSHDHIRRIVINIGIQFPGFRFPALEAARITFGSCKKMKPIIDSLRKSPLLKRLSLFIQRVEGKSIYFLFKYISKSPQLEEVKIETGYIENTFKCPLLDLSGHQHLKRFQAQLNPSHFFDVIIGPPGFDFLQVKEVGLHLSKKNGFGISSFIDVESAGGIIKISPKSDIRRVKFDRVYYQTLPFDQLDHMDFVTSCYGSILSEIKHLFNTIAAVKKLNHFSLTITPTSWNDGVNLRIVRELFDVLSKKRTLKHINCNVVIAGYSYSRKLEQVVFDATRVPLEELTVSFSGQRVQFILSLGNFYTKIHFVGQNEDDEGETIEGETFDGRKIKLTLPPNAEINFPRKMDHLKDVSISSWSLPADILTSKPDLIDLAGQLSPQLVRGLLDHLNSPHQLNLEINSSFWKPSKIIKSTLTKLKSSGEIASFILKGPECK